MVKPLVEYTLEGCIHCLTCMRKCPVDAIHLEKGYVKISTQSCIGCDLCSKSCPQNGFKVKNSHMQNTFEQYDYKVALVPGSFFADFKNIEEAGKMFWAIKSLGFDEVIDYSDVQGALYLEGIQLTEKSGELMLTSFCPCINTLIEKQYPMLFDQLLPLDYPVEVAAKMVRKRLEGKYERLGIYSLCDCISKMQLAKHPFGNENSQIDHAMGLSHIFPKANRLKNENKMDIVPNREGLCSVVSNFYHYGRLERPIISISGIDACIQALELAEFDCLDEIGLLALFACDGGCVGGRYLWSNPYVGAMRLEQLGNHAYKDVATIPVSSMQMKRQLDEKGKVNMKEAMSRFHAINKILEQLPQFDCGACGYPNCKALATSVYDHQASIQLCRVRKKDHHEIQ